MPAFESNLALAKACPLGGGQDDPTFGGSVFCDGFVEVKYRDRSRCTVSMCGAAYFALKPSVCDYARFPVVDVHSSVLRMRWGASGSLNGTAWLRAGRPGIKALPILAVGILKRGRCRSRAKHRKGASAALA